MASPPKQIFAKEGAEGRPRGLMPLLGQGEEMVWWRPLIIPFRPLVILYNLFLRSRGGKLLPLSRPQSPQLVSSNEERWTVVRDELGKISEVVVHRRAEAA